jgi:hypothetical protein
LCVRPACRRNPRAARVLGGDACELDAGVDSRRRKCVPQVHADRGRREKGCAAASRLVIPLVIAMMTATCFRSTRPNLVGAG